MLSKLALLTLLILYSTVGYAADFIIRAQIPDQIQVGDVFTLRLWALNKGKAAESAEIEITVPNGNLYLENARASKGIINRNKMLSETVITCALGEMAPHEKEQCALNFYGVSNMPFAIPVRIKDAGITKASIVIQRLIRAGARIDYTSSVSTKAHDECKKSQDYDPCYEAYKKEHLGSGQVMNFILN